MYYLLQQRLVKQGKLPSAFKVQQTPEKKKAIKEDKGNRKDEAAENNSKRQSCRHAKEDKDN